jgi:hypothetical protein
MIGLLDWIKKFTPPGVLRAWALARARQAMDYAAGPLGAWLLAHHASQTQATNIEQGLGIAGLAAASWAFDLWDGKKVNAKMVTVQATGSIAAANDPLIRKEVMAASGSPEALKQVVDALQAGKE